MSDELNGCGDNSCLYRRKRAMTPPPATMRALTIHRPWAVLIAMGLKPVENRTWAPPRHLLGQRLAIHAGKKWDAAGADWAFDVLVRLGLDPESVTAPICRAEGIVAVATVVAFVSDARGLHPAAGAPGRPGDALWFVGPLGWELRDVVTLPAPVPCKGAQGLWRLPPDVDAAVRAQVDGRGDARGRRA